MNRSYKFILVIIFALAIYLRIDAYLINNSFFTDEILLAQNIFERNYLGLFLPLNYFQSAPYLFLALSKFVSNFGINELCFRFIPFLSSLISVYLFYLLSKEIFQTRLARATLFLHSEYHISSCFMHRSLNNTLLTYVFQY